MSKIGFSTSMQMLDPKTGLLTRDGSTLFQLLVNAANGGTAGGTGSDTLTGKRIDGDDNTIINIATDSLKNTSGDDNTVVTGNPGTGGHFVLWDGAGNVADGPDPADYSTTVDGDTRYLLVGGTNIMTAPINLASYTVAGVPAAASFTGGLIYVSNESGGAVPAFSDGANWLRVTDRIVIS